MTDTTAYCIVGSRDERGPCEGPGDAVLVRGPFMSRARDATTEGVPACVRHGAQLFAVLHGEQALAALDEGRITAGPGGDDQAVADVVVHVQAAVAEQPAVRCPAAAIPCADGSECDGRHDAVLVRARFTSRIRNGLDGDVPACVHHGARLLVISNGGGVTAGPGGTEGDAREARRRAESAWATLAGKEQGGA